MESGFDDCACFLRELCSKDFQILVFTSEDIGTLVKRIVIFHQVVGIICDDGWTLIFGSELHGFGVQLQLFDDSSFFVAQCNFFNWRGIVKVCFSQNGLNSGIGVLDKRSRISVEINGFFGVE